MESVKFDAIFAIAVSLASGRAIIKEKKRRPNEVTIVGATLSVESSRFAVRAE